MVAEGEPLGKKGEQERIVENEDDSEYLCILDQNVLIEPTTLYNKCTLFFKKCGLCPHHVYAPVVYSAQGGQRKASSSGAGVIGSC